MASPKRPFWSLEKVFHWALLGSFLLHLAMLFLVMTIEPPPPPSQEEYATWLKKVTPPKYEEKVPEPKAEPAKAPKEEKRKIEAPKKAPDQEAAREPAPAKEPLKAQAKAAPKAAQEAKRAEVREKLSGAGLLAVVGTSSEEGSLANVFESGAVINKDLGAALKERGSVRTTGGARIGKKGALGSNTSADIGEVSSGAGGSAGAVGARQGTVPKAFVKSSEAVIKKGGIDAGKVNLALKKRDRGIQQCYEIALKSNPDLQGKLVLAWTIDETGRVADGLVKVVQNTIGDAGIATCITNVIKTIRFPEATEGPVPISRAFEFKSGG